MSQNLSDALIILAVGMITVFVILALVVLTGKLLIRITNKFAPPTQIRKEIDFRISTPTTPNTLSQTDSKNIDKSKIAAIVGTVEYLTKGKGHVKNIEKI